MVFSKTARTAASSSIKMAIRSARILSVFLNHSGSFTQSFSVVTIDTPAHRAQDTRQFLIGEYMMIRIDQMIQHSPLAALLQVRPEALRIGYARYQDYFLSCSSVALRLLRCPNPFSDLSEPSGIGKQGHHLHNERPNQALKPNLPIRAISALARADIGSLSRPRGNM